MTEAGFNFLILWSSFAISVGAFIVSIFWNQKLMKDQYKIQYRLIFVKEIYPPLMEDIRNSVRRIHEYSTSNIWSGLVFDELKKIYNSSQIEFIKRDSPVVYANLDRIMNEIIPQTNVLYQKFQEYRTNLDYKWGEYLINKKIYQIDANRYVHEFIETYFWNLWRGEYGIVLDSFEKEYNNKTRYQPNLKIPNKEDLDMFFKFESEEKLIINEEIKKMNILIKDIIEDKVIIELNDIISNPIT
jgi:hypothetical protein